MEPEIWIVRDGGTYRLLHGYLHLMGALAMAREVIVDVKNEGPIKVVRGRGGFLAGAGSERLPLRGSWSYEGAWPVTPDQRAENAAADKPEMAFCRFDGTRPFVERRARPR